MIECLDPLRRHVINLKHLDQDISDPIIAGAGSSGAPNLYVILCQEAAARFTPITNLYLSWKYIDIPNVRGYNMFKKISEDGTAWAICWPKEMRQEGTVEACLEIVDDISVDQSQHFNINVLADIDSGADDFTQQDFDLFHQMIVEMQKTILEASNVLKDANGTFNVIFDLYNSMSSDYDDILQRTDEQQELFEEMQREFEELREDYSKIVLATDKDIDCRVFHEGECDVVE